MLRKGTNVVQTQLKSLPADSDSIPDEQLFTMNDSHGLAPDMVITLARAAGWNTLRTGFSAEMAERHARIERGRENHPTPRTTHWTYRAWMPRPMYYDDVYEPRFEAQALACLASGDHGPEGQPTPWCLTPPSSS